MSIARVSTIIFKSQEAAGAAAQFSTSDFPSAQQFITIQSDGNKLIGIALYENQEAMDNADAARDKLMANPDIISMESAVGTVRINHTN
jgi:hypothetical protein